MAESSGEKTEQATPKKLRDAHEKGQTANSRDVSSTAVLLALFAVLAVASSMMLTDLRSLVGDIADLVPVGDDGKAVNEGIHATVLVILKYSVVFAVTAAVAGVVSNLAQIGFIFSGESMKPDLNKLNPFEGAKKIISMKNLFEFAKNVVKVSFLGYLLYRMISGSIPLLLTLCYADLEDGVLPVLGSLFWTLAKYTAAGYIVIAVVDWFIQRRMFLKQMMMTKDEVKREYKEMEGNQEVKQKQKELAQELMNDPNPVAGAQRSTVVVTNPTHLAVGLRYVPDEMPLPQVVCRGADQIAEMIKAAAREAGIPVMENVPLARALYQECRLDDYIPESLVEPVVEVLKVVRDLEKARQEEEELAEISVEDPE